MAKRTSAQKRAIKKAQRKWDVMHYSVAEGKIPSTLASGGQIFKYVKGTKSTDCRKVRKKADNIRGKGFKARTKRLTVKGKDVCLVYKGPRRKKRR